MKIKVNLFSKSSLTLILLAALTNFAALAQRTVTGTVTDTKGETLVGATVLVTGTQKGTVTDVDGKYSIEVPSGSTSLTFSYTGSDPQTVAIGASNVVDVKLVPNALLEGVTIVSTGYGQLKSKEVSSAIVNVRSEDFVKGAVNDPVGLLQGKVAGLEVSRGSGDPNGSYTILLRGVSTAIGNPQPLIVIDGIPSLDLNTIDPNDIDAIDVLKDGSASAIYGTRGSNGVLLVTTKKGKSGTPTVEYNAQVNTEKLANHVQVMDAATYKAAGGKDLGSATDWYDAITQTALSHIHNLAISGGVGKTAYRASLNYRNVQGIQLHTGNQTLNAHLSLTQKALNDKLTLTGLLSITGVDARLGNNTAFRLAGSTNPTEPIYSADPQYAVYGGFYQQAGSFDNYNPRALLEQESATGNLKNNVYAVKADYEIVPGLTLGAVYSKNYNDYLYKSYAGKQDAFTNFGKGQASQQTFNNEQDLFNTTLNYKLALDAKTNISLLGGYEYQEQNSNGYGLTAGNFFSDAAGVDGIQNAQDIGNGLATSFSYKNQNKVISFFGRANVGYDDTYNFMFSLRRDGSTVFGPNNKWGIFPAGSFSVNLGKLLAIKDVDLLKLRVGYGLTGALPPRGGLSQSTVGQQSNQFPVNGTFLPVYGPTQNANPDIRWEKKAEFNAGVDFSLMHNLTGSIDYYNRNISDLLYTYSVSSTKYLFTSLTANVGTLQSSGIEMALAYTPFKTKDLKWVTQLNFVYNLSDKLISLSQGDLQFGSGGVAYLANAGSPGLNSTNYERLAEGQPIGQIWGFKYAGPDASGNPLYYAADGSTNLGKNLSPVKDGNVLGHGLPDYRLDWNNSFNFSGFDAAFSFRGVFGFNLINENRVFYENNNPSSIQTYNRTYTKYWDPKLTVSDFNSSQVEKGDFLQLASLSFGYTIPMPKGSVFTKVHPYVSANNLFYITGYTGVSPEPKYFDTNNQGFNGVSNGTNYLTPGIDRRSNYFTTRSFSLGVNVGF